MTDYKKSTGNSGVMMIRVTATAVEFWINAYNSTTYNYALPWGFTVNGVTASRTSRYEPGAGWVRLGAWAVSSSQTVTFRLGDTGTGGLGGPTTFSVAVNRASIPDPPSQPVVAILSHQRVMVTFNDGDANGSAINARQIGYGRNSTSVEFYVSSDRSTEIGGLLPAFGYYFWARTHNAHGWSGWSVKRYVVMWGGSFVKVSGVWRRVIPYVKTGGVWREARPLVKRTGVWRNVGG